MSSNILSHNEMCRREGVSLQQGMNFAGCSAFAHYNMRRNHMPTRGVTVPPTTRSIASYVKKNAVHVKNAQKHKHQKAESVREADYKGHHIVIRTQYEI